MEMYIKAILFYLTWPLVIFVSWYAVKWVLKKFQENIPDPGGPLPGQTNSES